jgi:hypothetical protein
MSASCLLVFGEAVFRSAHTAPGRSPGRPFLNASTAAFALLTLSTRSAPRAASASLVMASPVGTAGS